MDQDEQWLINCLNATLDPNQQVRSFAETSLQQATLQPGFGSSLCRIAAKRELPLGLRQLAAVILKQFIKKHWQEGEEGFEHPVVSSDEKVAIRGLLLPLLDDPHRKICTAIGMAVASIAHYDWPEDWPDLLPSLMKCITDQTNMNAVHGALRCFALVSADLDDNMVPKLVPVLFPCLHTIVSSPQIYEKPLRMKALSIVYACTSMLGAMSGVYKTETSAMMSPMIQSWINQFSSILEHPVQSEDPDDWSIRMEVIKCLNQFLQNFPSLMESQFGVFMGPLWQTFVSSLGVYTRSSIEGIEDPYDGRYDSDGAEQSLESIIIQLFEFLLTILGSPKFVKVVGNNVKELVYYTIAFMQTTEQQVNAWSVDANQYVADEDDNTYSCRASGALLLEEVISSCGTQGIHAIIDSAKTRFRESQQEKASGASSWWRMREATLFALASVSEQLLEAEAPEITKVSLGDTLEQILSEDMSTGVNEYPFLYARIFSSIAKFSSMVSQGLIEHFLYAAIKALGMDMPPPVKVGACRALSQLLPDTNKEILRPHFLDIFSSLTDLLKHASDETMHLVLETLQEAVKAGPDLVVSIEPVLSPIILNMWASNVADPFVSIDALEVLEAIKNAPSCIHPVVSRVLPYIGPILNNPQQQPEGLVAASLDLVTMLLKSAPTDIVKAVYEVSFDPVVRTVLQSDDHSEMQNATQCLAALISVGKEELLAWGGDTAFAMRSLLDVASRLLDPDLESSGALFVGSYILQLILHLPSQMAQHIRDLVAALLRRMQSCKLSGLRSSLLVIFARLVHMSAPHAEQFIEMLVSIPAEGHPNSFVYLMVEWTKLQGEIQGAYQIKVTTTALALLLSTKHAELGKLNVQGYLIQSTAGITTRSKAKTAPDQWTMMPLPAKILALLADALIEIQEQVLVGGDEDSDWEEVQEADVETDEALILSSCAIPRGRPSHDYLDAMAKAFDEDQDDGDDDDLLSGADPLNEINLVNYLVDFLKKFSHSEGAIVSHLLQSLTKSQHDAIQMVLKQ
ncbi:importin-9 isoform X2 [Solanum tuberosum]|uniref:importin-9 isoform X1 n=1 Tax=Solanum tuberosum TaxID=4113 RepID=UPI0003D28171|nr:PREDICTED: importin-9 isoform X1 [Solanum tuberosum]XP_006348598.1 PREDICTED: importin-9 isoform X2 [Solanum tuberosum]